MVCCQSLSEVEHAFRQQRKGHIARKSTGESRWHVEIFRLEDDHVELDCDRSPRFDGGHKHCRACVNECLKLACPPTPPAFYNRLCSGDRKRGDRGLWLRGNLDRATFYGNHCLWDSYHEKVSNSAVNGARSQTSAQKLPTQFSVFVLREYFLDSHQLRVSNFFCSSPFLELRRSRGGRSELSPASVIVGRNAPRPLLRIRMPTPRLQSFASF